MRNLLPIACVGVILTTAWVEAAIAAPTAALAGPEQARIGASCGQLNIFGKGLFNGSTCEPVLALYAQGLEKSPCPVGCVMVSSEERGYKVLRPEESPKKGASCDWALYHCQRPSQISSPSQSSSSARSK